MQELYNELYEQKLVALLKIIAQLYKISWISQSELNLLKASLRERKSILSVLENLTGTEDSVQSMISCLTAHNLEETATKLPQS